MQPAREKAKNIMGCEIWKIIVAYFFFNYNLYYYMEYFSDAKNLEGRQHGT
jgi:hypothetical protein